MALMHMDAASLDGWRPPWRGCTRRGRVQVGGSEEEWAAERALTAVSQEAPVSDAREPGLAKWRNSGVTGRAGS